MAQHPTYAFPQLVEAICELHFSMPAGQTWHAKMLGEFYKAVQAEYPSLEPVSEQTLGFMVGPDGASTQQVSNPRTKFKLTRNDGLFIITIGEGAISVSSVQNYPGWIHFKSEIERAWDHVLSIVGPRSVLRVGMRYINRVQRLSEYEKPSYWLKKSPFVTEAVLKSEVPFLSRVETSLPDELRNIVTVAFDSSASPGFIFFDIDLISLNEIGPKWETVSRIVEKIHSNAYSIFNSSISKNYKSVLETGSAP